MKLDYVTIFPAYFAPLDLSLVGKAVEAGILNVGVYDLRDWAYDVHRSVDDTPMGGGAGMVMKPEPWGQALDCLLGIGADTDTEVNGRTCVIIPSPSGELFSQSTARELADYARLIFACGRYEGIDARVAQYASSAVEVRELSLGDYVLNGGEVAALAMTEAIVRLLPGFVGNPDSLEEESHSESMGSLLEYPVYTKPASWRGMDVPEVLLSGHHAKIAAWRLNQAEELTRMRRPDLLGRSGDSA
ncbi:MAG: tRNA (guanosine(37)-N1)-methyltransferase TrmD [Propionibacteriaceae bacterium]|nr:tRNA (guanosine(37)-N1)-methyltransferase TrmD [Propionibacteriaceae bacterium]